MRHKIVGIGEILWDCFPKGRQLGGAVTNFAYHAAALGHGGLIVSRIGRDALGQEILDRVDGLSLDTRYLQQDETFPTGTVLVEVDTEGQPLFTITEGVAWDFVAWVPTLGELARQVDVVCFGTLAQRAPVSRATIRSFLQATRPETVRILDVNLRQSFYTQEILKMSLQVATAVKLNDTELPEVIRLLDLNVRDSEETGARALLETFGLTCVCVTRGAGGSLILSPTEISEHPGVPVQVADTVGSGDAFTAVLAHHLLQGTPLQRINEASNRYGAWVASQVGGTPPIDASVVASVL